MASTVTFCRKNRSKGGSSSDASSALSTYVTAPSVLTPVPESPGVDQDENEDAVVTSRGASGAKADGVVGQPAARWRRKNAVERQEAERRQHLAEMRAYFEEVDAFDLAVETPPASKPNGEARAADARHTPPPHDEGLQGGGLARALAAAAPTPGTAMRQRAMSLGLSRRRSSMVAWPMHTVLASSSKANQQQSPLKLNVPAGAALEQPQGAQIGGGRRSTLLLPAPHRLSVSADNAGLMGSPGGGAGWAVNRHSLATRGRRSSMAPSRLSGTGQMLSRLSVGLTDALQWLGIRGKIPTASAAAAGGHEQATAAAAGDARCGALLADRPALSPIASPGLEEGEEEGSPAAEDSMSSASKAVTALEQLEPADESSVAVSSPAPSAAVEQQPVPSLMPAAVEDEQHLQLGAVPALEEQEEQQQHQQATQAEDDSSAAAQQADAEAVQQLEEQIAEKLQLQETTREGDEKEGQEEGYKQKEQVAALPQAPAAAAAGTAEDQQQLGIQAEVAAEEAEEEEELTPLQQLLSLCGQETDPELLPTMDELLGQHVDLKKVRKIGEGTFGEAFRAGGVVLKIVPMAGSILVNGEPQKRAEEILAEVSVTLTLSRLNGSAAAQGEVLDNVTSGFVETFGVGVCRGAYSATLCREWHRWDKENESENEAVDIFEHQEDQLFVVFVVADGGLDLEHFELRSFQEVRSILLQTALAVAVAEESCQFEHRDLHWGNLLIRRSEQPAATAAVRARLRGVELEAATEGVTVTLIDFTLSRLVTVTGEVAFCDLAADPELFKGPKGSVQAETYRRMKKATRNSWERHVPATNVYWMQYLVDICLTEKKGWACSKDELAQLRGFKRRISSCDSCAELLLDDFLRAGILIRD